MNTEEALPNGHQREDCPKPLRQSWFMLQPFSPHQGKAVKTGVTGLKIKCTHVVQGEHLPSTGQQLNTSPRSPAGSKFCSLPMLTPQQTLVSAAQPRDDSRLMPHRSHSYQNEPLHSLPSTKEYPSHSTDQLLKTTAVIQSYLQSSGSMGLNSTTCVLLWIHSCWGVWAWLTPMGTHFHIPATRPSNLILHLESIICFISIICLNHNFAVSGERRRVRPNSYLSKKRFKFLFKHLRTRPTWIHPLPQKFHLVSCPA